MSTSPQVPQDLTDLGMPPMTEQSDNILEIMSGLQDEINRLKGQNEELAGKYNQLRLMMFPTSVVESHDSLRQVKFSWLELVKQDPTLDLIGQVHKHYLNIAAECTDFVEEHRSKISIKTSITNRDKAAKETVDKTRSLPKTQTGKLKMSSLDKAIDGFRKTMPFLKASNLIEIIKASPMYKDVPEAEIQASLDKLNLRDANRK